MNNTKVRATRCTVGGDVKMQQKEATLDFRDFERSSIVIEEQHFMQVIIKGHMCFFSRCKEILGEVMPVCSNLQGFEEAFIFPV